jgi:hypothetical protein
LKKRLPWYGCDDWFTGNVSESNPKPCRKFSRTVSVEMNA